MPGSIPMRMGKTLFHTAGTPFRLMNRTYKLRGDFDQNDGGIQDSICIKNERERHGERRKPIANGTIYKGRKQSDPGKNDQSGVKGRHL